MSQGNSRQISLRGKYKSLPSSWALTSLPKAIKDKSSGHVKLKKNEILEIGELPVVDQGKEFITGFTDKANLASVNLPVVIFGDHTRNVKFLDFDFAVGADGVKIFEAQENVLPKFLFYFIKSLEIPNTGYNRHYKYLKDEYIPLPSLEEQRRIAAILDKADAIRRKQQQAIELCDQFLKALFIDMFTKKESKFVRLEEVVTKITDGVHAKPNYTEYGVPFISVKNISNYSLKFENCKFISKEDHEKYFKRCNPEKNDILYTKVGARYGRACINDTDEEFSLYVSVALVKPIFEKINPYYLISLMNSHLVTRQADRSIKGIGVPDLHLKEIKAFNIPLPPLDRQNKFAEIVKKTEAKKDKMQTSLERLNDNFNALSQKAFKGEL